jgi:hypothetical protein
MKKSSRTATSPDTRAPIGRVLLRVKTPKLSYEKKRHYFETDAGAILTRLTNARILDLTLRPSLRG